jgi:macrophage erythroblast attacher
MELESHIFRVEFECWRVNIRGMQKLLEKEGERIKKEVLEVYNSATTLSTEASLPKINKMMDRLQVVLDKVKELKNLQNSSYARCIERLGYLRSLECVVAASCDPVATRRTRRSLNERILIDYMLRNGYLDSARYLCESTPSMDSLVDFEVHRASQKIAAQVRAGSFTEALAWCAENRSKLKKFESTLEFDLRVQEFVELLKIGATRDALLYSKKYLAGFGETHPKQLQRVISLLAFTPSTPCGVYRSYFAAERWTQLAAEFTQGYLLLFALPSTPTLFAALTCGLTVLKTPFCYDSESASHSCPVCLPWIGQLARNLPYAHHSQSVLVCRISGSIMDHNNPPLAFMNGMCYGREALQQAVHATDGTVTCPRSGARAKLNDLVKVFVA